MAKISSTKNNIPLKGSINNDTITVKHTQIAVTANKGNDRINVNKGSKHTIYGEAGNDTVTIAKTVKTNTGMKVYGDDKKNKLTGNDTFNISGGKKNSFYGGKGTDIFYVNAGTSNYLYGGTGNDTFIISKNSTGTATVKDFSTKKGNKDTVQVIGGAVKSIKVSGKHIILTGGKSGKASLTLEKAKGKTFAVTDSRGNYTVSDTKIVLGTNFTGTLNAASYLTTVAKTTIDARNTTTAVNVTGNAKSNTIYVGYVDGGTYQGGAGDDKIIISSGSKHIVYGDDIAGKLSGNDTITLNDGDYHKISGGAGKDVITVNAGVGHEIDGGNDNDNIIINYSKYTYPQNMTSVNGGNGADTITLSADVADIGPIHGGNDGDIINVHGKNGEYTLFGDAGNDTISLFDGVGDKVNIDGGSNNDIIKVFSGKEHKIKGNT